MSRFGCRYRREQVVGPVAEAHEHVAASIEDLVQG